MSRTYLAVASLIALAGCAPKYTLVSAAPARVAHNSFGVHPGLSWNKAPRNALDIPEEEQWTANGPLLDRIDFVGGLAEGHTIVKQRRKADQKVPSFVADMSPQDLVGMVEVRHRIEGATVFETTGLAPRTFLGKPGLQLDYRYVVGDEVKRRGRAILVVVNRKLYLMTLDGAAQHYFDAALPDFETMVGSATL